MEVFKLKFFEEPQYEKLQFLLANVLLLRDKIPDLRFDWSKWKVHKKLAAKKDNDSSNSETVAQEESNSEDD